MSNEIHTSLSPLPGLVIPRSRWVTIRYVVFCYGMALFGIHLEYSWWNDRFGDGMGDGPFSRHRFGFMMGLLVIGNSVAVAVYLLRTLRKEQRIIVGEDRLQMVEKFGETDEVVVEIPFVNIQEVKRSRTAHGVQVELMLDDPVDPDTYLGIPRGSLNQGSSDSWPIQNGFKLRPYRIADELEGAIARWKLLLEQDQKSIE